LNIEIDGRMTKIYVFDIERLGRLGFNKYYFVSPGFIQKYKENEMRNYWKY
jgi:hypothetical protein